MHTKPTARLNRFAGPPFFVNINLCNATFLFFTLLFSSESTAIKRKVQDSLHYIRKEEDKKCMRKEKALLKEVVIMEYI